MSQPTSSATACVGLPRIDSCTSMPAMVAGEHGGGPQVGLAVGKHGEFDREATGLGDPALHVLGDLAKVALQGVSSLQGLQIPLVGLP